MSLQKPKTENYSHFSLKSYQIKNDLLKQENQSSPHMSLSNILKLRIFDKVSSDTKPKSKHPVFAKFLQKSPNSYFKPLDKNSNDSKNHILMKMEPLHLTQTTRKEGPARHRNTIKLKLDLINRTDSQSIHDDNEKINKQRLMSFQTQRSRARTSITLNKTNTTEIGLRLSFDKETMINKQKNENITKNFKEHEKLSINKDLHESQENIKINKRSSMRRSIQLAIGSMKENLDNLTEPLIHNESTIKSTRSGLNVSKTKVRDFEVGYNICKEMRFITTNHFFNKINEKMPEEAKKNKKAFKKEKNNIFYEDLMLSHYFVSALKDHERERFSRFLMNDWVNKLIFERKINDTGVISEFLDNSQELEKLHKSIMENQEIREKFTNYINKINKTELFKPQNILNKFRESIKINPIDNFKKTLKFSNLSKYLSSKDYNIRDHDYKTSQEVIKALKVKFFKKKRKILKPLNKTMLWEIKDAIMEYAKMVKELSHVFSQDFILNKLQRRPFESNGSYMFLKFVKKGKLAYIEKMLKEDPKLIFDFDLVRK